MILWPFPKRHRSRITLSESRLAKALMQQSGSAYTSQPIRRLRWKSTKNISLRSQTEGNRSRERLSSWKKWNIRLLCNCMKSLIRRSMSSWWWNTSAEALCMDTLSQRATVGSRSGTPRESSNRSWRDWNTVIQDALPIEISSLRTCCWTTTITSRSSISGFRLAFLMRRRSKSFVVLHHIWRRKLSAKRSTVVHQPIFGPSVFSSLPYCQDNFLIGVPLTKSSTIRFAEPTISFQHRFKKPSALKPKTSLANFSPSKLTIDRAPESSSNILGLKVLRLTTRIKFKLCNPVWSPKLKFKNTFRSKKERNLKSLSRSHLKNNRVLRNKQSLNNHKFNLSILSQFPASRES